MSCPSCGYTDWKLVKLAHEQGLHKVNTSSGALGGSIGSGGINAGIGSSNTTGTVQSILSARAKPPNNYLEIFFAVVGLLAGLVAGGFGFFLVMGLFPRTPSFLWGSIIGVISILGGAFIGTVLMGKLYSVLFPDHAARHKQAVELWSKRRMCLRCGTFYDPV